MNKFLAFFVALAAIGGAIYLGRVEPHYPPPPSVPGPAPSPSPLLPDPTNPGGPSVVRAKSIEIVTDSGGVSVRITTQGDRAVAEVWDGRKFQVIDLQKVARYAN